ncbi:hypothetical protein [Kribbella qitaiheensis]|uniref:hypothetical protein n=1 Tax=Kribbella qitaiheensis TaxID=1544730 RepID=UPI00162A9E39|nr:hypothetical protein [Kribbella qitaiheensis]
MAFGWLAFVRGLGLLIAGAGQHQIDGKRDALVVRRPQQANVVAFGGLAWILRKLRRKE